MKTIKQYWKEILICLLAILFLSKCSSSGNYERKYKKEIARTEFVVDSMNNVYANSSRYIDSLTTVINIKNMEIDNLNSQVSIYQEQNRQLVEANQRLANKQVVVKVNKD